MTKWHGLARNKRPAQISSRKIEKLNGEVDARIALAKRCGGQVVITTRGIPFKDGIHLLTTFKCVGGICEICKYPAGENEALEPHESPKRSAGGKVSLKASKMCHRRCHPISKPMLSWLK